MKNVLATSKQMERFWWEVNQELMRRGIVRKTKLAAVKALVEEFREDNKDLLVVVELIQKAQRSLPKGAKLTYQITFPKSGGKRNYRVI